MAKLTRATQKVFGSTAGSLQVGQFGSLANGSPVYTMNPVTIQALIDFTNGWFDAVMGDGNPAIEDMNGLFFLAFYQLAYGFQAGVPEWDAGTTYYIGSVVSAADGMLYVSLIDTNLNQALTTNNWLQVNGLTKNASTGSRTIASGYSLTQPQLNIQSTDSYLVQSGGALYSFDSITIQPGGSLTVAPGGSGRII